MTIAAKTRPKGKIFYGWWMVLASIPLCFYSGGTFFYGFGAFFNPILEEFGWSRAALSAAFSIQRFESGIAGPLVGFLADRVGPRKLIFIGTAITGLGFLMLSQVTALWQFYGGFVVISIGVALGTFMVIATAVANWFVDSRGRAFAVLFTGYGASGALAPVLVWLIAQYEWRNSLVIIAIGTWLLGFPTALVMRHRPEQYGYLPDGKDPEEWAQAGVSQEEARASAEAPPPTKTAPREEVNFTAIQALRTGAFWWLSLVTTISFLVSGAIVVHEIPALVSFGISRETAAFTLMFMTLLSLIGRWLSGFLSDIVDKRLVFGVALGLQALGALIFASIREPWHLVPFLLVYGPGYGGVIPVRPALQGEWWGRQAFGSIMGLIQLVTMVGGIVGPVFAGWMYDITESYRLAFFVMGLVILPTIPIILRTKRPQLPESSS